jgi:iron complex outermembrane receptor protein
MNYSYSYDHPRYGIPLDPDEPDEVRVLNMRRHNVRATGGLRDLNSFLTALRVSFNYNDYQHQEIPNGIIGTVFKNKTFLFDGMFDQQKKGRWSGTFGYWGMHRDFAARGEETLSPPTLQNAVAGFALETLDFQKIMLQFGGRFEHNGFTPEGLPDRSFNGASAAAGVRIRLWEGGAFVANYTHSYRAPAIEELYNNGPHDGTLLFEVGDPNLKREVNDGIDFSLRHSKGQLRAEVNYYYYHIRDFVFLAPTGELDEESGFEIANYSQGTSRFQGTEAKLDIGVHRNVWLNFATDYVNAKLTVRQRRFPAFAPGEDVSASILITEGSTSSRK